MTIAGFKAAWAERYRLGIGATRTIGRVFIACEKCGRVVPHWRVIRLATERHRIGCRCGHLSCRYIRIPEWQAAWWVLVRGYLIRKFILRKRVFDPRIPWRSVA
jgi:hypothetical protein